MRIFLAKKSKIFFVCLLLVAINNLLHAGPVAVWSKSVLDSVPSHFHKKYVVDARYSWWNQGFTLGGAVRTSDGGTLMVGNTETSIGTGYEHVGRDGVIFKVDSLGNAIFAKVVGLDTVIPIWPDNPYFTWDIEEYLRGVVILPDSGFIVMCPRRDRARPPQFRTPFLARFDKFGNVVWAKDFMQATYLYTLNLTPNGNILVSGQYSEEFAKAIVRIGPKWQYQLGKNLRRRC
jgi:hypothetical protein